ncbi:MAG: rod-binding protein [Bdellovibrionales bacterium]|nr:rod-binding protein [Bdellovibrionales bacterium]
MKIQNGFSLKPPTIEERNAQRETQLREAAKMYETHFLNEMVKSMRKTVGGEDGLIKKNMAEKIFSEQLDGQYVDNWAAKGGVGLADMIYNQIAERYLQGTKNNLPKQPGVMPIAPKQERSQGIQPTDSIQMKMIPPSAGHKLEYRFEVPDASGGFEAQAPLAGQVVESARLGENWSVVKLDHGRGLTSELTFPGRLTPIDAGTAVGAGHRLGMLDPERPVLAWKLDWTEV